MHNIIIACNGSSGKIKACIIGTHLMGPATPGRGVHRGDLLMSDLRSLTRDRYRDRYGADDVPWDASDPPPEVTALAAALTPGRALDLGCGYGRAAIALGRLGWCVDGIDYVEKAVSVARSRSLTAGVADRVRFVVGDVTHLAGIEGPYDLVLDVGCCHGLEAVALAAHARRLARLQPPGAWLLMFAHLRDRDHEPPEGRSRLDEATLVAAFRGAYEAVRIDRGTTPVDDEPHWPSAWLRFRRAVAPPSNRL
jgi:SAM-dependent methyltransferase